MAQDALKTKIDAIMRDVPQWDEVKVRPVPVSTAPPKRSPTTTKAGESKPPTRTFVVYTQDMVGLGWVKKLQEEGEEAVLVAVPAKDEKDLKEFNLVGNGWVNRTTLEKAPKGKHVYHLFDSNHLSELADKLRGEGEKVFGTSKLQAKMEHDRKFTTDLAKQSGLDLPDTQEFSTVEKGLAFLDAHQDTSYVFKPDASEFNYLTTVPMREKAADANRELYFFLKHSDFKGTYILQERKEGVEVNVELWLQEGEPFFSFATLENKRKGEKDSGEMVGCAGDVTFVIPHDSKLATDTIGKMLPFYKKEKYTGIVDINVIIGDRQVWFLEVCNRFGYNSHPNLFMNLALDGFGSIMADWMDGKTKGMPERFRKGYGASVSLFIDHKRPGIPLHLKESYEHKFFPFDGYKDGDDLLLTGYSQEVGIFTDYDYTLHGAMEGVYNKLFHNETVSFTNQGYRQDLDKYNYPQAPDKRHEALRRMGLIT
jgi:phosphoribosylamine-glycine ligase